MLLVEQLYDQLLYYRSFEVGLDHLPIDSPNSFFGSLDMSYVPTVPLHRPPPLLLVLNSIVVRAVRRDFLQKEVEPIACCVSRSIVRLLSGQIRGQKYHHQDVPPHPFLWEDPTE